MAGILVRWGLTHTISNKNSSWLINTHAVKCEEHVAVYRSEITEHYTWLHWECNKILTQLFRLQQECEKELKCLNKTPLWFILTGNNCKTTLMRIQIIQYECYKSRLFATGVKQPLSNFKRLLWDCRACALRLKCCVTYVHFSQLEMWDFWWNGKNVFNVQLQASWSIFDINHFIHSQMMGSFFFFFFLATPSKPKHMCYVYNMFHHISVK